MPKKKSTPKPPFNPATDSRYDRPFKFLKKHQAYLVTLDKKTSKRPGLYDVVPDGGDRAIPKGIVRQSLAGIFESYLYTPGHAGDLYLARPIGDFRDLDTAIAFILDQ